ATGVPGDHARAQRSVSGALEGRDDLRGGGETRGTAVVHAHLELGKQNLREPLEAEGERLPRAELDVRRTVHLDHEGDGRRLAILRQQRAREAHGHVDVTDEKGAWHVAVDVDPARAGERDGANDTAVHRDEQPCAWRRPGVSAHQPEADRADRSTDIGLGEPDVRLGTATTTEPHSVVAEGREAPLLAGGARGPAPPA